MLSHRGKFPGQEYRSLHLATRLASTTGGNWRGGRGRRTSVFVGVSWYFIRGRGSELRNSGTRELVGSVTENVDEDTGVVVRDRDTGEVELGTSGLISQVKGDDLVTKELSRR